MKSFSYNVMINVKSILRLGFLLTSIFLLSSQNARATHIVGGDLTYRCLGGNVYELKLTMRRDCFQGADDAQFDDPASIGIYDGTNHQLLTGLIGYPFGELLINFNSSDTLNEFLHSDCSVVSGDVCVHTTMYVKTLVLPYRATGYTFAYQRCCRNSTLNNVFDPLNTGMTLVAELSGPAQLERNSAPHFLAYPPIYICVNKDISFDHHAVDIEGDSLVYALCTPYAGGDRTPAHNKPQPPPEPPYDPITWRSPYSLSNLLGGDPLKIDPHSGLITGTPNTVGQFVVGVCVTGYKKGTGVMTGTTRRDFQYNVRMCRDVPIANFTAPSFDCHNTTLTVHFTNQSALADDYKWIFDYGNPNSPTSAEVNPTHTYSQGGFYQVALIVSDSGMFCHDTIIHQVGVFNSQITADFNYEVSSCTEAGIVLNVTDQSGGFDPNFPAASYQWLVTVSPSGTILSSGLQSPTFNFNIDEPSTVFLALVVTSSNGCSASQTKSFPVREISLQFNPLSGHICNGESTHILLGGDPDLNYTWSPTLGLDTVPGWDPLAHPNLSTPYNVTITDGLCVVTGQTHVEVQQLPVLAFGSQTDCKSLTAQFTNTSTGILYHWDFGVPLVTSDTSALVNPVFVYPAPGNYDVTLSSQDGCDVETSQTITVNNLSSSNLPDEVTNCFHDSIELNPNFNPLYTYSWSPAAGLSNPNLPNPKAGVLDDTKFYVTITQAGLLGCQIVDSVIVLIPSPFTINAPDNFTNCKFSNDTLVAVTEGGDNNITLVWMDINNNTLGTGPVLIINPENTTTYIVTGTDSLGCSKSDFVVVSKPPPSFSVTASHDTTYCDIKTIALHAASNVDSVTFEWFNAIPNLIGTGPEIEVTPGTSACFNVIGTDSLGCQNKDTVCLTPTFFDLSISNDQSICLGDEVTLCVTDHSAGQNLSYVWAPTGDHTPCITVTPADTTTFGVVVTNDDLGCKDTLSADVVVNIIEPIDIVITAIPDTINISESTQLFVSNSTLVSYIWSSSGGDQVPSVWNPIVTPTDSGGITYTVTVTNAAGCTATASITIRVLNPPCNEQDIFLPNAFTPNDDGHNDMLFVRSQVVASIDLHIYNRWGQEVFFTNSTSKGWDGKFKGERLAPDVFGYYMSGVCVNGRSFKFKGNITLLE